MANQPGRRQAFRFWQWANPTQAARPPTQSRRPGAGAPPRTPSPKVERPSPPARRRPRQSPPSPTQEAPRLGKEEAAATQEVSPAPSLFTPPFSQPESPTKKPEPEEQSLSEPVSQPPGAGRQTTQQVSKPETVPIDVVPGTLPTQDLMTERESKKIKEKKLVTSEDVESTKEVAPEEEEKLQIDTKSKQDGQLSQLPPVEEKRQMEEVTSYIPQVEKKSTIEPESQPSHIPQEDEKPEETIEEKKPKTAEPEELIQETPPSHIPEKDEKPVEIIEKKPKTELEVIKKTKPRELIEETLPSHIPQKDEKHEEISEEKPKTELEVIKKTKPKELIQETRPSHIPQKDEKPEEIIEEKPKTELGVIKKTEPEELIEATQPSQIPREVEKPKKIIEQQPKAELEMIKKTEPEELIEDTQPSQIPQEVEKPKKIIEQKPKAELEMMKKTEPSETASEENKKDEPKTKPAAQPVEKSTLSSDESKDGIEKSEAPRPHPGTSEFMTELRGSVKQKNLDDSKGRESTIGTRRIPWASTSHGERTSFHKEIKEGISKLVQKLKLGQSQQLGSERAVSIITLAGENSGATMFVGHETTKKESVLHINKKSVEKEIQKQMLNHTDRENPAITASINSNVQGINNSLLQESSCSEEDPGVHLVLSTKPNEPAKSKESAKSSAATNAPA